MRQWALLVARLCLAACTQLYRGRYEYDASVQPLGVRGGGAWVLAATDTAGDEGNTPVAIKFCEREGGRDNTVRLLGRLNRRYVAGLAHDAHEEASFEDEAR